MASPVTPGQVILLNGASAQVGARPAPPPP
jgi:hypothetical protein